MVKPKTRNTDDATSISVEDIQRLIAESENRLLSRIEKVSQRLQSIESTLETVSSTMNTSLSDMKKVITEERMELQSIKQSSEAGCLREENIIAELPTALAQSRRLEKATESASHEVIVIGLSEDIIDLQEFSIESSRMLNCFPPSRAQRIGRPGSSPRLVCLSFTNSSDARVYRLSATRARREDKVDFRARPSLPKELRSKLRLAASLNRDAGEDTSYSVREDGQIWKFVRSDGKWIRDANWSESIIKPLSEQKKDTQQQGN